MTANPRVKDFALNDHPYTFYPTAVTRLTIAHADARLAALIQERLAIPEAKGHAFSPQQGVFPAKQRGHLRRTLQLDPMASYFLYDLVYRNRSRFRESHSRSRLHFGNTLIAGDPVDGSAAYSQYKAAVAFYRDQFRYHLSFDIATYFNHIYHHDLVDWMESIGIDNASRESTDRFLREINAGRSVDCLPQGYYPAKILGNHLLAFVDDSSRLRCKQMVRFMDDFHLFDNDESVLLADFNRIQRLLGDKGLSVNPQKTKHSWDPDHTDVSDELKAVKVELLRMRRAVASDVSGCEMERIDYEPLVLSEQHREFLTDLLRQPNLEEDDAELVLTLMREYSDDVVEYLDLLVGPFPNLTKRIYAFCKRVHDKQAVAQALLRHLRTTPFVGEYELFWFAAMLEDQLRGTEEAGELYQRLLEAEGATDVSISRVLEIPEHRFGMPERREELLRSARSDWQAWSAAFGTRTQPIVHRNKLLKYFASSSPMNALVASVVSGLKGPP